jgi:hypothetical protein
MLCQNLRKPLDVVAAHELGGIGPHSLDRVVEALHPLVLPRPDERAQQPRACLARDVDRRPVDPDATANRRSPLEKLTGNRSALLPL